MSIGCTLNGSSKLDGFSILYPYTYTRIKIYKRDIKKRPEKIRPNFYQLGYAVALISRTTDISGLFRLVWNASTDVKGTIGLSVVSFIFET